MSFRGYSTLIFWVALACGVSSLACTNGAFRRLSNTTRFLSPGFGSNGTYPITITSVVKDVRAPGQILDLVGDGSGSMGQFCPAAVPSGGSTTTSSSSSGTGSDGGTPCACILTYARTNPQTGVTATESFEVFTTYSERDLIRCDYSAVPQGTRTVKVKLHLSQNDAYSNEVEVTIEGNYGDVDISVPSNFAEARRYQCRENVTIYTVTGSIYDPIQSEDPHIFYPLDFYTTNFGATFAQFASQDGSNGWSCPQNPSYAKLQAENVYNMRVYSTGDLNGNRVIFPPKAGQFDRSRFFLSKVQTGVYTHPVNAFVAPYLVTTNQSPIGYGANAIPTGAGREKCPDGATKPAGYHWVKVWLFRADLEARTYLQSNAILQVGNIMCNPPGLYKGDTQGYGADNCTTTAQPGGYTFKTGGGIADRILGTKACIQLSSGASTCGGGPGPGCSNDPNLGAGTDLWKPVTCNGDIADPMGVCTGAAASPKDGSPVTRTLQQDISSPRYDYLFVVSPPEVNTFDMENRDIRYSYTPFRFIAKDDCDVDDPNDPSCDKSKIINYRLMLHDVTMNADPPAGPQRPVVYPVCALQPD